MAAEQRYRDDGFPLCPQCDEDELWNNAWVVAKVGGVYERPPVEVYFTKPFTCYGCGWQGTLEPRRSP